MQDFNLVQFAIQLTNVTEAFNGCQQPEYANGEFGAYAIALTNKFAAYPNTLKKKLTELSAKTKVKFVNSKITKVSHRRLIFVCLLLISL